MKTIFYFIISATLLFLWGCNAAPPPAKAVSREAQVTINYDSLKRTAQPGDLLLRLGDDALSYQIKNMNEKDLLYSHAGIIVERGGQKLVAHLAPEPDRHDTIQYTPIDSFLIKEQNLDCALYRYKFSGSEREKFIAAIDSMKKADVHFDWLYDLNTNKDMYCSEMISKALAAGTSGRMAVRAIPVPKRMLGLLSAYFKGKATPEAIAARHIITIDNLYLRPDCEPVMHFRLKYLPGE